MTWKLKSTSKKNGRIVTLNPNFLDLRAAESFKSNLEGKWGSFYTYEIYDAPSRPRIAPGRTQPAGLAQDARA